MLKRDDSDLSLAGSITKPIAKIYAIGEVLKGREVTPATLDEEEINYGLGVVLTDLVPHLEDVREKIMDLETKVALCNREHQFRALK